MFEINVFSQVNDATLNCQVVFMELGVEWSPQRMARSEANTTASSASLASCYCYKHNFTNS